MNDEQQNNLNQQGQEEKDKNENLDTSALYLGDSRLQTKSEFEQNKKSDHTKEDNKVTSSGIDDLQSNSDGAAGTDRAGTAERKAYGDIELNKGLEAQAKDEES
ncbi:hypothetical protein [Segetibacter koreensis]|uniref:hypothetical protein n=1 Tax=Segetibacter koreensis TaxID=398037 RepID=UPI00036E194D|nr:hypothetical protein [Segetibacter koreensis]